LLKSQILRSNPNIHAKKPDNIRWSSITPTPDLLSSISITERQVSTLPTSVIGRGEGKGLRVKQFQQERYGPGKGAGGQNPSPALVEMEKRLELEARGLEDIELGEFGAFRAQFPRRRRKSGVGTACCLLS
jgi:hypothetical protein